MRYTVLLCLFLTSCYCYSRKSNQGQTPEPNYGLWAYCFEDCKTRGSRNGEVVCTQYTCRADVCDQYIGVSEETAHKWIGSN